MVVPFWGSCLASYKVIPKKELVWSLWVTLTEVVPQPARESQERQKAEMEGPCEICTDSTNIDILLL